MKWINLKIPCLFCSVFVQCLVAKLEILSVQGPAIHWAFLILSICLFFSLFFNYFYYSSSHYRFSVFHDWYLSLHKKLKFSIKYFFSECDQMRSFLRIWSHLLRKSLMENFILCAVSEQSLAALVTLIDN